MPALVLPRIAHRASLRMAVDYADPSDGSMSDLQHLPTLDRHNQEVGLMVVVPTSAQPPTSARACDRDGARRDPAADHPAPARARTPRDYIDLLARDRHERDRRHSPPPPAARDPGERRPATVRKAKGHVVGAPRAPSTRSADPTGRAERATHAVRWEQSCDCRRDCCSVTGGAIRREGDGLRRPSTGAVGVGWKPASTGSSFRRKAGPRTGR